MDVRLVVLKGNTRGRAFKIENEEAIIGRRQDCDVRVASAEVSRRHCLLSVEEGVVRIEDLDSVNGTYLNGRRVTSKQVVRPGDRLEVGPICFVVEYNLQNSPVDELDVVEVVEDEEELDVLPLADEERDSAFAFDRSAGNDAPLPVDDEETAWVQPDKAASRRPREQPVPDEEEIPMAEEIAEDWQLPPADDLRGLISDMDDKKSRRRRS